MIGALSLGKKAVTFGYKRYGVLGAVASGGIALVGYIAVRRALQSATNADEDTLESAIDEEQLRSAVDENDISSSVSEITDEFTGEADDSSASDHSE